MLGHYNLERKGNMRIWLIITGVVLGLPILLAAQGHKQFIQAELLKTIKASKARAGDPVKARVANSAILPGRITISEGTMLLGEVRAAEANSVAISFDEAEIEGKKTPVKLSIRAAMMPGGQAMHTSDGGSAPPEVTTRRGRDLPSGDFDRVHRGASNPKESPVATKDTQTGRNVAAQTGSVIGMPSVTLEIDESPQHASKFVSSGNDLQLKGGLQLMLGVVE
jgi:hypothetical protein